MFTDESKIEVDRSDGRAFVWCKSTEEWLSCFSSPDCHANDHCTLFSGQLLAFAHSRQFPKRENNCKSSLHDSVFKLMASHCTYLPTHIHTYIHIIPYHTIPYHTYIDTNKYCMSVVCMHTCMYIPSLNISVGHLVLSCGK